MVVLDRKKRPLMPCTPKRARKLLEAGRARVHLLFPFRIRLVERIVEQSVVQPLRLSIDPGSNSSGLAISRVEEVTDAGGVIEPVMHIVFLMELAHRGRAIMDSLLAGYEVREYLLKKFNRMCAYCDVQNVPLQIEHIEAKARAGSNRVSNLALACGPCNAKKAAQDMGKFLLKDPVRLAHMLKQAKAPLRPCASSARGAARRHGDGAGRQEQGRAQGPHGHSHDRQRPVRACRRGDSAGDFAQALPRFATR